MDATENRLPANVKPKHYRLQLEVPDLTITRSDGELVQNPYSGFVHIDVDVLEPTDTIVLNAKSIDVSAALLKVGEGKQDPDAAYMAETGFDEETERLTLTFPEVIPAGEAQITIDFTSTLASPTKARGLYQSIYTMQNPEGDFEGIV